MEVIIKGGITDFIIKDFEVETWFIPGDWLLGMEFLSTVGRELVLNLAECTVKLTR